METNNNIPESANMSTNPQQVKITEEYLKDTAFGASLYGPKWAVVEERTFSQKEIDAVDHCEVVAGKHGLSMCFFFKNSSLTSYIAIDKRSSLLIGATPDIRTLKLKTLINMGDTEVPLGTKTLKVDVFTPTTNEAQDFNNPFNL